MPVRPRHCNGICPTSANSRGSSDTHDATDPRVGKASGATRSQETTRAHSRTKTLEGGLAPRVVVACHTTCTRARAPSRGRGRLFCILTHDWYVVRCWSCCHVWPRWRARVRIPVRRIRATPFRLLRWRTPTISVRRCPLTRDSPSVSSRSIPPPPKRSSPSGPTRYSWVARAGMNIRTR